MSKKGRVLCPQTGAWLPFRENKSESQAVFDRNDTTREEVDAEAKVKRIGNMKGNAAAKRMTPEKLGQ